MKKRRGWVSNSSSSSFIIKKQYLNDGQLWLLLNYQQVAKDWVMPNVDDEPWIITEEGMYVGFYTFLDNFPMWDFLERIGVNLDCRERLYDED